MKNFSLYITAITSMGVCFSGYITFSRFITGTCPLNEPCPYFLGYPACWYGFALFSVLFVTSVLTLKKVLSTGTATKICITLGLLGVLFAGYFTIPEVYAFISGATYTLGLPTCAYGLIFYAALVILAAMEIKYIEMPPASPMQ
ncbi:MAG: hypothetical protein WAX38_03935 [Minisyncoccia bacterium]